MEFVNLAITFFSRFDIKLGGGHIARNDTREPCGSHLGNIVVAVVVVTNTTTFEGLRRRRRFVAGQDHEVQQDVMIDRLGWLYTIARTGIGRYGGQEFRQDL